MAEAEAELEIKRLCEGFSLKSASEPAIPNKGNNSESRYSGEWLIVSAFTSSPRCFVVGPAVAIFTMSSGTISSREDRFTLGCRWISCGCPERCVEKGQEALTWDP